MKQLLKMIIILSSFFTLNAFADNQACLMKAFNIQKSVEDISRFAHYELLVMNDYHKKTIPQLSSAFQLGKAGRLIENDFYSLIQQNHESFGNELKRHINHLNELMTNADLANATNEFNKCPNQEAQAKCSQLLNNLKNDYSEFVQFISATHSNHTKYSLKQTEIYESLKTSYQTKTSPNIETIDYFHGELENQSYSNNEKMKHLLSIAKKIQDNTGNELVTCLYN